MRTYRTPIQLHKFNSNNLDECCKCRGKGTLHHCGCQQIQTFWLEMMDMIILHVTGINPLISAKLCILGIFPENCEISKQANKTMITFCFLQEKHTISWTSTTRPSPNVWLTGLSNSST